MTDTSSTVLSAVAPAVYRTARPSPHLSWGELACRDGTPYPPVWEDRGLALAAEFECIREACGNHPLLILSAYRTPSYNARCGGAVGSRHLEGRALDIQLRAGWDDQKMFRVVRAVAQRTVEGRRVSAIRGIGRYPGRGFIHIDIRPDKVLSIWWGHHARYLPVG